MTCPDADIGQSMVTVIHKMATFIKRNTTRQYDMMPIVSCIKQGKHEYKVDSGNAGDRL